MQSVGGAFIIHKAGCLSMPNRLRIVRRHRISRGMIFGDGRLDQNSRNSSLTLGKASTLGCSRLAAPGSVTLIVYEEREWTWVFREGDHTP